MQIKKHTVNGRWVFGEYDFYINNHLIAKLRRQLIGTDYAYLYFLPELYGDENRTRLDLRCNTSEETLKSAIKIVKKKLYASASAILTNIKTTEIEG